MTIMLLGLNMLPYLKLYLEIENFDQMKLLNDTPWENCFLLNSNSVQQCIIEIITQKK